MSRQTYRGRFVRPVFWGAATFVWFSASLAFAQSTVEDLYAVTSSKRFLRVDTVTGTGTLIAILDVVGSPYGLAALKYGHGEGGQLWVVTTSNRLHRIDPETGTLLTTNVLSAPDASGGDLALGNIFSSSAFLAQTLNSTGSLVLANRYSGASSVAGALSPAMEGLDVDAYGNLYGMSAGGSPSLYLIDRTNGTSTLVGALGISLTQVQFGGLAIQGAPGGDIYAAVSSVNASRLYALAPNGAATLRGLIGFSGVSGLALHVRRPGPLRIMRQGSSVVVSWPATNGGYLWRRTNVTSLGSPIFQTVFPITNRFEMFYLSPHPPL